MNQICVEKLVKGEFKKSNSFHELCKDILERATLLQQKEEISCKNNKIVLNALCKTYQLNQETDIAIELVKKLAELNISFGYSVNFAIKSELKFIQTVLRFKAIPFDDIFKVTEILFGMDRETYYKEWEQYKLNEIKQRRNKNARKSAKF